MNLRDKLRAVGGQGTAGSGVQRPVSTDCRHSAVFLPSEDFPGAFDLDGETLALMGAPDTAGGFDPRRVLYLDTETTGLGGAGTVAFLVGMGYLTENGFEVHQFLMRDYPEEPYLLKHVAAGLGRFNLLCTFNGATFDVPLLETRFRMNRMDPVCLSMPHIDLLQMSRRLWRLRLKQCSLGRLEDLILNRPRGEDLPGGEVPQRYFTYLKTGQEALLEDVLTHNARDIASLCMLLNRMARLYRHPEEIRFSEDAYAMGRALEKNRRTEQARRCYRLASRGRMGGAAGTALAHSYRRAGEREEAERVWLEMIRARQGGAAPYVELAKFYEHQRKDIRAAMDMTERALSLLAEASLREDGTVQETKNEVQYRYARLKRKLKEL